MGGASLWQAVPRRTGHLRARRFIYFFICPHSMLPNTHGSTCSSASVQRGVFLWQVKKRGSFEHGRGEALDVCVVVIGHVEAGCLERRRHFIT